MPGMLSKPLLWGATVAEPYEEYECCASGSCEVCNGMQGLIRFLDRYDLSDDRG